MLSLSAPMRSRRSTLSTSMLQRLRQARAERELQTPAAPLRQAPLTSAASAPVVVVAQTPTPPSAGIERPTLRRGSRSSNVALAQRLVGEAGFSAGPADGIFGPKTESAIKNFQAAKGLPATGVVDAATWNVLEGKAINTSAPATVEGVAALAPNTEVSPQQLIDIAAGGGFTLSPERAAEVAPFVSEAMQIAGIDTVNDKAAFVAQLMHESAAFRYNEEIHDGSNYEGRRDLGNTQPGDGRRFKGRGFIQLTGRANYEAASRDLGIDFVNNPDLAANDANAAKVAAWYWQQRNISVYGDAGDIVKVSKLVNGGTNGLEQRKELFYAGVEIFENAPLAGLGNGHVHHPVLDVIRGELGVSEATGRNDGIPQERYSQGRKDPWCAHFVAWAFRQTGAPLPGDRPLSQNQNLALGSVQHMEDQMRAAGTLVPGGKDVMPQPGDVIFFASRGRSDSGSGRHVGIVEKVENGRVHTIEGNSSNSVRRRSYPLDHYNIANYGRPSLHQPGAQDGFVVPTPIFESEFNDSERSPAPRSPAPRAPTSRPTSSRVPSNVR